MLKPTMTAVAALLASLSFPAMATTDAALSASGFSVTLKDLNTGDGIAPSISWTSWVSVGTTSTDAVQQGWAPSGMFMYPAWSSGSEINNIQSTPGAFDQVSMYGHGTQQISASGTDLDGLSLTAHAEAGQNVDSSASMLQGFTLSAGTQVTFSLTVNGSWSGTAYPGVPDLPPGQYASLNNASVSMTMSSGALRTEVNGSGSVLWPILNDDYESSLDGEVLKLTVKNNTAGDKDYYLSLDGNAHAYETAAPVPEPSGYAMLGAGLLLMGAVARRRRG